MAQHTRESAVQLAWAWVVLSAVRSNVAAQRGAANRVVLQSQFAYTMLAVLGMNFTSISAEFYVVQTAFIQVYSKCSMPNTASDCARLLGICIFQG